MKKFDETFIAWGTKRTINLRFIFTALLAVSIMCMPACSSDSDNAAVQPNYTVQATVSVEEDGPVASALVMDGDKNLLDTLDLTINGDPMIIEYLGGDEEESTEAGDGSPIYTMDLPDLKGGDMVVFEARDQFGVIIYAPEPAVIPMAIELIEPTEGQELVAGDEVIIRWTGGEAEGVTFGAGYESLDGESSYFKDTAQSKELTIPVGQTQSGNGVIGAGAVTGETQLLSLTSDELMEVSYFFVSTATGISLSVTGSAGRNTAPRAVPTGCPDSGYHNVSRATVHCHAEFAFTLGFGSIIWNNRYKYDVRHGCTFVNMTGMRYCTNWRTNYAPMAWVGCCNCQKPACPG